VFQCQQLHSHSQRCKHEPQSLLVQKLLEVGIPLFCAMLKIVKCNRLHKVEHYRHFTWCCKANFKTNLSRLETKQGKPCPHSFKCLNCKDKHQADSNTCLFWKHCFNYEWHSKKYQELHDVRSKLICLFVDGKHS